MYVEGRNPENANGIDKVTITLKEDGPVLKTILVESEAPGCENLNREITIYKKLNPNILNL